MRSYEKYLRLAAVFAVVAAVVLISVLHKSSSKITEDATKLPVSSDTACGRYRNDRIVTVKSNKLIAETANNLAETQKGLSGRPCIPADRAMLFGFTKPGYYPFWMKDMRFPIDIVWIGPDHKVVGAIVNLKPSTYPQTFKNKDKPAQYVIELKAYRSKELGIQPGTVVNF